MRGSRGKSPPSTLISKQWPLTCVVAGLAFIFALYTCSVIANSSTILKHEKKCEELFLSESERGLKYMIIGASGSSCVVQLARIITSSSKANLHNTMSAYIVAFAIMIISFSSELIMTSGHFSTVCEDSFGVRSPIIQIAEWQITVPLMIYLTLTLDTKKDKLAAIDYLILAATYIGIIAAFVPILCNRNLSILSLGTSVVAIQYSLTMNVRGAYNAMIRDSLVGMESPESYLSHTISVRRLHCAVYLYVICLFFPLVFFSRVFGLISNNLVFSALAILNFISKNLFAIYLMEGI